jgi:hypothetical protein
MKRTYQIAWAKTGEGRQRLARFLAREGRLWMLPMLELIETGECVVDELIDVVGRTAIDQVYGRHNPVQHCGRHKERNVLGHLPKEQHDQAKATLRGAWRLDEKQGMAKIEQYASWLQRDWPSAAGN